jgi:hypothetical protein
VGQEAAVVLGQKVPLSNPNEQVAVGDTVSVFGTLDGENILASRVVKGGVYVPGATSVLLSGTVQKMDNSLGRAVVGGLLVDLTPTMSNGAVSLAIGSQVQISGTQPVSGGLVVGYGVSGGDKTAQGISGTGLNGISGGKTAQGISGTGLDGISGGGKTAQGISGTGLDGISGGGKTAQGISGTGLNGISGGGKRPQGISGGGQ